MALNMVVDALDDVPEAAKELYRQDGDRFVLDVEGVDAHPSVANLKSAFERQKADAKSRGEALSALKARIEGLPEDFNAEAYTALLEQAEAAKAGGKKPDEELAKLRKQMETKHAAEIEALTKALDAEKSVATGMLVDDGLTRALVDANVKPELRKAAHAMLRGMVKVSEEDGKRSAIVETDMGPMALSKFVSEWAAGSEGAAFVAKPAGGGAPGGGKPGAKTIRRSEFDKLDPASQRKTIADGMAVVDG